jgi:hypothetical protein
MKDPSNSSSEADAQRETLVQAFIRKIQNHPVLAVVIVIAMTVIAIASFSDALDHLYQRFCASDHVFYGEREIADEFYAFLAKYDSRKEAVARKELFDELATLAGELDPKPKAPRTFGRYRKGLFFTRFDVVVARSEFSGSEWILGIDLLPKDGELADDAEVVLADIKKRYEDLLTTFEGPEMANKERRYLEIARELSPLIQGASLRKYDVIQYDRTYGVSLLDHRL